VAVLFVAALFVQLTHAGIDIFLMLVAGFILLVLERTLGDWIAESVGAPATVLIFTVLAGLGSPVCAELRWTREGEPALRGRRIPGLPSRLFRRRRAVADGGWPTGRQNNRG